jgi:hypothetical protein
MTFQPREDVIDTVTDVLHDDTQAHNWRIDLTADSIYTMTEGGSLDFGGSEYEQAGYEEIQPEKKNPDDDYGWWHLDEGTYRVEYNEGIDLDDDQLALVTSHQRLLMAGGHHSAQLIASDCDELHMQLHVGDGGLHIKENARLSSLFVMDAVETTRN